MRVHLIRHGEVENPEHVVYADLPGFTLSVRGQSQAAAAADRLDSVPLAAVVVSPLERAIATATPISVRSRCPVEVEQRLTEWLLGTRWAGVRWEALRDEFPGELEAYLQDPLDLPFSPEPLLGVAERVATAVTEWSSASAADVAFVSHQDPIHSAIRLLTDTGFDDYHANKPEHCSITTLEQVGRHWRCVEYWAPPQ